MTVRMALIADDLTGALDAAVQFRNHGLPVEVSLSRPLDQAADWPDESVDVTALSTASRADSPVRAVEKVLWAGRRARGLPLYKKIDSTLRGNVGSEIEALLTASGVDKAVLAPAFPAQKRTTVDGVQLFDGCPISEASFAADPVSPVRQSFIPAILREQTLLPVDVISLQTIARGPEAVAGAMRRSSGRALVCDAESDDHLRTIAAGAATSGLSHFLCGSAGLAAGVAAKLGMGETPRLSRWVAAPGPLLLIIGSRHQATKGQLDRLMAPVVAVEAKALVSGPAEQAVLEVAGLLGRGEDTVLTVADGEIIDGAAGAVAGGLAAYTAAAVARYRPTGLVISGGDVALAVCRVLGARALRLEAEVLPGVPVSIIVGGPYEGLTVVTKAGGFGREDALERVVRRREVDAEL